VTPTFFTDRDLGKQFPTILIVAGLSVRRHVDLFAPETPDEEWLARVGRGGWLAITHDGRIRYKPNEKAAVLAHRVALLVLVGHAPYPVLAGTFVRTLARIVPFAESHTPPYIAKVYRPGPAELARDPGAPGRVDLWFPK
jgi:hypothetical protein